MGGCVALGEEVSGHLGGEAEDGEVEEGEGEGGEERRVLDVGGPGMEGGRYTGAAPLVLLLLMWCWWWW